MAIPLTGPFSFDQVAAETGYSGTDATGLINSCNNQYSTVQVDKNAPYEADDFRGYDHSYVAESYSLTVTNEANYYRRWKSKVSDKNGSYTGQWLVRYKVITSSTWTNLHTATITVQDGETKTITGTVEIIPHPRYDKTYIFEFIYAGVTTTKDFVVPAEGI